MIGPSTHIKWQRIAHLRSLQDNLKHVLQLHDKAFSEKQKRFGQDMLEHREAFIDFLKLPPIRPEDIKGKVI